MDEDKKEIEIITHRCCECSEIIASYRKGNVSDYCAADICSDCFEKYKIQMAMIVQMAQRNEDGLINIYED